MMKINFLRMTGYILFFLFCFQFVQGQSVGDYRSNATGLWNSSSTWSVYDGSTWVELTSGYPGIATVPTGTPTSKVTITHQVTIPTTMISPINLYFGDLIINGGKLIISPNNKTDVNFKTTYRVTITNGTLNLSANQLKVTFPEGAQISVSVPGGSCTNANGINGLGIIGGDCSNNVELWIGGVLYSTCTGNGGAPFGGNFCDINNAGGTVKAFATPLSLCIGQNVELSTQSFPEGTTYRWTLVSGPYQIIIPESGVLSRTVTLTPTVAGTYFFKIAVTRNGATVSDQISIKVGESSIYSGGGVWSNGKPDTNNRYSAVIASDYTTATSGGSFTACSCTVNAGKTLTISPNTYVSLEGSLINNGAAENVVIESDGNLLQKSDSPMPANYGSITAKRNIKFRNDSRQEFNYLISPVVGQSLKTIYPGVPTTSTYPYVLYYNEGTNYFGNSTGAYIAGRGLAVQEPSKTHVSALNLDAVFKGVPANGEISIPLAFTDNVMHGYNLVGNPYPSNIDLQKLYALNSGKITSTFYFWDNTANDVYQQQGSGYSGRAYAVYNALNGTGNEAGYLLVNQPIIGGKKPGNIVKVGQGFMVRAQSGGNNLLYKNSIRVTDQTGSNFFSKGAESTTNRYWVKLITPANLVNTIAVVHFDGGKDTFGMDDSELNVSSSDMFYSIATDRKIQIEGRPAFEVTDKIMLGSSYFVTGTYTIALGDKEGVFHSGQPIYLKDRQTGIITNLSEGNYTFAANAGESTGRFEILYQQEGVLATDGDVKEELVVYRVSNDFVLKSSKNVIKTVEVYDGSGRMISQLQPNSTKVVLDASKMSNGVYILKINRNNMITTKKIIK